MPITVKAQWVQPEKSTGRVPEERGRGGIYYVVFNQIFYDPSPANNKNVNRHKRIGGSRDALQGGLSFWPAPSDFYRLMVVKKQKYSLEGSWTRYYPKGLRLKPISQHKINILWLVNYVTECQPAGARGGNNFYWMFFYLKAVSFRPKCTFSPTSPLRCHLTATGGVCQPSYCIE